MSKACTIVNYFIKTRTFTCRLLGRIVHQWGGSYTYNDNSTYFCKPQSAARGSLCSNYLFLVSLPLSIHLSVFIRPYLSFFLFICLYLSVRISPSFYVSVRTSPSFYLSVCIVGIIPFPKNPVFHKVPFKSHK